MESNSDPVLDGIAIIGIAGRFPGASTPAQFWQNLRDGVESIARFTPEELEVPDGIGKARQETYVRARAILERIDLFDPEFFGIYPQEAKVMDPQHRIFLECCWEAFEDAGYDVAAIRDAAGVFAGCSPNSYFLTEVCRDREFVLDFASTYQVGNYTAMLGAIADTLATRVAYKLNLRGPAMTVLSACSTSLVAVCQACSSLLTYQCDVALAGGVSITLPQKRGYLYQAGGMVSPDGHCRTFDEQANGTVFGSGAGVVLLKRCAEAVRDGDHIYGIVRGFATNNDGASKVGFTAPSVEGQASVIAMAQAMAGIDASTISYIEAHGTATPLGDPIEIAALTQAFQAHTTRKRFCAIGTAKPNVGHLDVAAGVTGLIKTALSLSHRQLPPVLHFSKPNPKLNLEASPFYVNDRLAQWENSDAPRRAGVSAFGVGGTNAHVVIEEAPAVEVTPAVRPVYLLPVSARSEAALRSAVQQLAGHLEAHPDTGLADTAYTLQTGRRAFDYRLAVTAANHVEAIEALRATEKRPVRKATEAAPVHFLFPGQGAQYLNMGLSLYRTEAVFRSAIDECARIASPVIGEDLREAIYAAPDASATSAQRLHQTKFAQPALFSIEYALARLLLHWGVQPSGMIGHSVGEFVAATLAGVFSLNDALTLVAQRGILMQALPGGSMLSVRMPEAEILPLLNGKLSLAAVNAATMTVVSGPLEHIGELERQLAAMRVACRRLQASHAFHSSMMDPVVDEFSATVKKVRLSPPRMRYVSSVTGDWITDEQATDPMYWAKHLRQPVRFGDAAARLISDPSNLLLEVGPGNALQSLVRQNPGFSKQHIAISTLVEGAREHAECHALLGALGALWSGGAKLDWSSFYGDEKRRRTPLPTYPFERKRYWVDPPAEKAASAATVDTGIQPVELQRSVDPMEVSQGAQCTPVETNAAASGRRVRLVAALVQILVELSGMEPTDIDPAATFLEIGFDSLFLTQVAQAVQSRFSVQITFRQLLAELTSVEQVADFLDVNLPALAFAEPVEVPAQAQHAAQVVPPPAAPLRSVTPSASGVEQVFRDQLQAMQQLIQQQMDFLRGDTPKAAAPLTAVSAPVLVPVAAASQNKEPADGKKEFKAFGPYKPIQQTATTLSNEQRRGIDALIARYTAKTAGSKSYTQKHRAVLADPRVVSGFRAEWKEIVYPLVVERSRGSRLWDVDGNEYIDLLNGFGPIALGHLPEFVVEAAHKQLDRGIEIGPQTPLAGEVAELLSEVTGCERVTFCNTGSEAVMAAMRLARTVTGRKKIVFFAGDYHGNFDEVLAKNVGSGGKVKSMPIAPGIPAESVQNVVILEFGSQTALDYIKTNANEIAGVLVEPVQSRHPNLQPRDFLHELRKLTSESGAALIFDEIVTGFRVHLGGAQAFYGIRADLATYGKVLGGGFPIGAVGGSRRFMDALDGGFWSFGDESFPEVGVTFFAGTFVRHPLALAAAKAVLTYMKEAGPGLQEGLAHRTTSTVAEIQTAFDRHGLPVRVEHCGSIFYFSFPHSVRFGSLLYYHLREKGVHIQEGFPCFLTSAHTDADLAHVVRAFSDSLDEMCAAGLLPESPQSMPAGDSEPAITEAPITQPQLEILLSAKLSDEANCSYNEAFTLSLRGQLDEPALASAIDQLLARHDGLRATFDLEQQRIRFAPRHDIRIESLDFSTEHAAQAKLDELIHQDAATAFDLEHGPLVRVRLARLGPDRHILLFTSHHIVCDGWSTNVLVEELGKLYTARKTRSEARMSEPMSFARFAVDEAAKTAEAGSAQTEQYWINQFKELPPPLDLPTDRPRPAVKDFAGGTVRRTIGPEATQKIRKAGAAQGSTLFVTLLSGFEALLSRLTSQSDVVVGIPSAAQSLLAGQTLVGHCVNFLPIRARVPGGEPFRDLLRSSQKALFDAYENQSYTFGTLIRKLGIIRDPSRLPLVEVQFNLERVGSKLPFDGLEVEVDSCPKRFVNFDLFLNIVESSQGLVLDCDYNKALFDEATVLAWLSYYEQFLLSAAADPSLFIGDVPLLPASELNDLVFGSNQSAAEYPKHLRVHELFERKAAEFPSQTAVSGRGASFSYAELNQRADKLASVLAQAGAGRGTLVALLAERSADMVTALLAILKTGAAYLPLDPAYPKSRLDFILEEARPAVVLTETALAADLNAPASHIVLLDGDWAQRPAAPVHATGTAEDLAYVIYTSGSTGKPKGVQIPHRALVNFLYSMQREPGLQRSDRLLAVTTISFDIAALEIFLPLVTGATVFVASREDTTDGSRLHALVSEHGITVLQATPSSWLLLLEAGWEPNASLKMLCGGEALTASLAEKLARPDAQLWNMYGPTETTVWSAVSLIGAGAPVRIGSPIANTQFYVLSESRRMQPSGVPGELYIAGDGVAAGYFNRPELTAERFLADPFRHGNRMYRTGDLVRALPGGQFEFLGRLDDQVKIRGFRIELGEIESVLANCPGIKEVAVAVREERGAKQLVAFCVAAGNPPEIGTLRARVTSALPAYMMPSFFTFVETLPRTPNGKLDRRALSRLPVSAAPAGERREPTPAANPMQAQLVAICNEVLASDQVGIDDDLFELGADSIQVFRIVSRANRAGMTLTAGDVLRHRTVENILTEATMAGRAPAEVARKGPESIVRVSRQNFRIDRNKFSSN